MPRIKAYKKKYKLADLQMWIKMQMCAQGLKQGQVAKELGITQQALSKRLKPPENEREAKKKDPFSFGDLLILFDMFDASEEDRLRLTRM